MPRMLSKRASALIVAFPVLILGGCSDSLTSTPPSPSTFSTTSKQMGKTLSAAEQKRAIADLQNETARRQGASDSESTASVKPAEAQN